MKKKDCIIFDIIRFWSLKSFNGSKWPPKVVNLFVQAKFIIWSILLTTFFYTEKCKVINANRNINAKNRIKNKKIELALWFMSMCN